MKTLVEIPDRDLKLLAQIGQSRKLSRAAVIREAIEAYLLSDRREKAGDAFGLWGKRKVDGLEYQRKLRDEW
ncbi:MAG: ribbon-helix-helix protein, CopG family [Rhizomicrobium sp.]